MIIINDYYKCLYCNDSIVPLDEDSKLSEI